MGGNDLVPRVFATLVKLRDHGGGLWMLYLSKCSACAQDWLVAEDELTYDNFYLKRISPTEAQGITDDGRWPDDFITYERVLRLGRSFSGRLIFLDPHDPILRSTAQELLKERSDMTVEEIAYLLSIEPNEAARLLDN